MKINEQITPELLGLFSDISALVEKTIEKYSILVRQYFLLFDVYRYDGIKLSSMSKDKPFKALFYRDIEYLHEQKMLTKRKGKKYKKLIYLHLTAYGETIVQEVNDSVSEFIENKFSDKRKIKCMISFLNEYTGEVKK